MSDERYYTVTAKFDPSMSAPTDDPWVPAATAGQAPSDMRTRRLVTAEVGWFPPEVLGRNTRGGRSLVQVWTEGPVARRRWPAEDRQAASSDR